MTSFPTRTMAFAEGSAAEPWRAPTADGSSAWTDAGRRPREDELDAIRQAAREEGYAAGVADGRAAMEARARQLEEIVAAAVRPLDALDDRLLEDLATLVLKATEHVLRREALTDPTVVREALELALETFPGVERDLVVRVHPRDVDEVRQALADSTVARRARVDPAPELEPGGVELIAGPSRIDVTVEARLAEVFADVIGEDAGPEPPALGIVEFGTAAL
ncbi:MAG: FliH/SctL family protein [Pseudomonadales bacterium]|jgi:flagellar assembly protein FliH|nr:FliH/SctL family protein [Pseudomonadales bacterium]